MSARFARVLVAFVACLTLAQRAQARSLTVPIPPGNEDLIRSLTSPLPHSGPLGVAYGDARLESIQINAWFVDFVVRSTAGESRVRWSISPDSLTSSVQLRGVVHSGARALAQAIEHNGARVEIRPRAPSPPRPTPKPSPPAEPEPSALWVLLAAILYAIGLVWGRRGLIGELGTVKPQEWGALVVIAAAGACIISALPETVVYHRGHGWRWVQTVAGQAATEPHNGVLAALASRLLGLFAPPGMEAHVASRVAYVLSIPAGWLWARSLWRNGTVALWCAGLLATQPALLYLGNSHYSGSVGMLLLLMAGFHVTAAARAGTWGTIAAASGAMALLLNWRFSGVVVAPGVVVLGLSVAVRSTHSRRVWLGFGAAAVTAVLLASAHWYGVFERAGVRTDIEWASLGELWRSNLFARGHAASIELAILSAAGLGACWWWCRNREGVAAQGWLLCGLLALIATPLWFGVSISNGLLDELRYCSWAVPGTALAASATALLFDPPFPPRARLAAFTAAVVLALGSVVPGSKLLAIEHPEQLQLRLIHELTDTLAEGATVAYPSQRGLHRIDLPLLPLRRSRPDLTFVAVSKPNWQHHADYWLEPLICHIPKLIEPSERDDAPDACLFGGDLEPVYRLAVTLERVPSFDNSERPSMRATDGYWVSPPVVTRHDKPPFIGLYAPKGEATGRRPQAPQPER